MSVSLNGALQIPGGMASLGDVAEVSPTHRLRLGVRGDARVHVGAGLVPLEDLNTGARAFYLRGYPSDWGPAVIVDNTFVNWQTRYERGEPASVIDDGFPSLGGGGDVAAGDTMNQFGAFATHASGHAWWYGALLRTFDLLDFGLISNWYYPSGLGYYGKNYFTYACSVSGRVVIGPDPPPPEEEIYNEYVTASIDRIRGFLGFEAWDWSSIDYSEPSASALNSIHRSLPIVTDPPNPRVTAVPTPEWALSLVENWPTIVAIEVRGGSTDILESKGFIAYVGNKSALSNTIDYRNFNSAPTPPGLRGTHCIVPTVPSDTHIYFPLPGFYLNVIPMPEVDYVIVDYYA